MSLEKSSYTSFSENIIAMKITNSSFSLQREIYTLVYLTVTFLFNSNFQSNQNSINRKRKRERKKDVWIDLRNNLSVTGFCDNVYDSICSLDDQINLALNIL